MATQITEHIYTDKEIELQDIPNVSLRSNEESNNSEDLIDIAETSFTETLSGNKYEKIFVIKKSETVVL